MQQNYLPVGLGVGAQILERWNVSRILGSTPLCVCVAADDSKRELRPHAVRIVAPLSDDESDIVEALVAELERAMALDSPNIAKILSCGKTSQGHCYVVTEFVRGLSVANIVAPRWGKGLTPVETHHLLYWAARALASAHKQGVIHRNFRTSNVILKESGQVKVVDFGLGPLYFRPATLDGSRPFPGDLAAVAPEELRGEPADVRTDIYSFGIFAYEVLTGRKPFDAATQQETMQLIREAPFPDVRKFRRGLPPHLIELIAKTCARDRTQRAETMFDIVNLLEPFAITDEAESCTRYTEAYTAWEQGDPETRTADGPFQEMIQQLREQFHITPKMLVGIGIALTGIALLLNSAFENQKTLDGVVDQARAIGAAAQKQVNEKLPSD